MRKILAFLPAFLFINFLTAQIDISEARTKAVDEVVTIQGIVTHGPDGLGPIRYIQDATGALPVYSPGDFSDAADEGVEIKVTGKLTEFHTLLQIGTVNSFEVISTGNPLPTPEVITPNQMSKDNEGELVTIRGVVFDDGGTAFAVGTYDFSGGGESSVTYVRGGHPLVGTQIPLASVNITGIVSVYDDNYQLLMRGVDDLEIADAFYVVNNPTQSAITNSGFTLSWTTNEPGTTVLKYGTTTDLSEEVVVTGETENHTANLTGLEPATFYYAKAISEKDGTTVESSIGYFSTESNSTGEMKVYFNKISDPNFSTGPLPETNTPIGPERAIIDFIDNAKSTIDVAVYNNNRPDYRKALDEAHDRGVRVRYVTNTGSFNSGITNPQPKFKVLPGNSDALMHNKFVVIDAESEDESYVITGSMNWTDVNELDDYNNMISIQDQALAKAYEIEFEEMWGSDGATPGIFSGLFGGSKKNNTPHQFMINGSLVESYFSPSDNTTVAIENAIKAADSDLQFAILSFTRNELGTAVRNAHRDNIDVRGIIENTNDQGTEFDFLQDEGVNVINHPLPGTIHHKYALIDAKGGNNPLVITGSHNWSTSAEVRNDENTLMIYSADIANLFLQEFEQRWCELNNAGNCYTSVFEKNNFQNLNFSVSPNPMTGKGFLEIESSENFKNVSISIFDLNGKILEAQVVGFEKTIPLDLSYYPKGTYFVKVQSEDFQGIQKVLKQ